MRILIDPTLSAVRMRHTAKDIRLLFSLVGDLKALLKELEAAGKRPAPKVDDTKAWMVRSFFCFQSLCLDYLSLRKRTAINSSR